MVCVRKEALPLRTTGSCGSGSRGVYRGVGNSREGVGAAGHGLAAAVAVPDAPGLTANGVAAAEGAGAEG